MSGYDYLDPETPREERAGQGGDAGQSGQGGRAGRHSGWHALSIGHLVMGLAFLGLFTIWLLITTGVLEPEVTRWILPVPWLFAGAVGIIATMLRGSRRAHGRMQGWLTDSPNSQP